MPARPSTVAASIAPANQPGDGDWYAKYLYDQGRPQYEFHLKKYGHPSKFGFKDVINTWKAEKWDPAALLQRFKGAGAKFLVQLANHHDNFDNYNSTYQPWNSVNMGPNRDIVGDWRKAALMLSIYTPEPITQPHGSNFLT